MAVSELKFWRLQLMRCNSTTTSATIRNDHVMLHGRSGRQTSTFIHFVTTAATAVLILRGIAFDLKLAITHCTPSLEIEGYPAISLEYLE